MNIKVQLEISVRVTQKKRKTLPREKFGMQIVLVLS